MTDPPHACIGKRCIFGNELSEQAGNNPESLKSLRRIVERFVDSEDTEKPGKGLQGYPYLEVGQG
jgi:hypothetical protein